MFSLDVVGVVCEYARELRLVHSFGSQGAKDGEFKYPGPGFIAMNDRQQVWCLSNAVGFSFRFVSFSG
jgi:hypothetical protein